jgi:nitrate/nitrite-specific signal transduction histidine kinase
MADPGGGEELLERIAQLEAENHTLASLYVAAYQLHASLELREVVQTIADILTNFVGARTFAVYVVDERGSRLAAGHDAPARAAGGRALVELPLRASGRDVGAVAIWELVAHKPELDDTDRQLLDLLGAQAGLALEAARLAAGGGAGAAIV